MSTPSRFRREATRFWKFLIVGTFGAVIDFGIFNLLNTLLGVWYLLSGTISFIAAVTSNFIWNRFWTYPDSRSKPIASQAAQFALVNVVGLALRTPILALMERPMVRFAGRLLSEVPVLETLLSALRLNLDPTVLGRNLSLALAVLIVLFWNFGANRIWTYSDAP